MDIITVNSENIAEVMQNIPIDILETFVNSYGAYDIDDKVSILKSRMQLQSEELYRCAARNTIELYYLKMDLIKILNGLTIQQLEAVLIHDCGNILIRKGINVFDVAHIMHNSTSYAYFYGL